MPKKPKAPLTGAQRNSVESQLRWWLGSVRRSVERFQFYDAEIQRKHHEAKVRWQSLGGGDLLELLDKSSLDDLIQLLPDQTETEFISRGFDEAQILVNALAQVDSHLSELEDDWNGTRRVAGQAYRDVFKASHLRDLRNAIEHMAEHAAGRQDDGRVRLSPVDTENIRFDLTLAWPVSIAMFGITYPVSDVVDVALEVDEAWGSSKDRWPTPRSRDS